MVEEVVVKSGKDCVENERELFEELVLREPQVGKKGLATKIEDAHLLILLYIDSELVSIAAIKNNPSHQKTIAQNANFPLSSEHYFGEIGYIHTAAAHRNNGYSKRVLKRLVDAVGTKGLFATVQSKN